LYVSLEYVNKKVKKNLEVAKIERYMSVDICAGDISILDGSMPTMKKKIRYILFAKKEFSLEVNAEKI
jgi:hypothetical protein